LHVPDANDGQPLSVSIGKGIEHAVIEHAEDGGGQADTQSKRGNGDGGEARVLAQLAQRITKVPQQGLHSSPL
jgi:hypothetical protein